MLVLHLTPLVGEDAFTKELHDALVSIGKNWYQPILVGLGGFTYEYGELSGPFSRYLEDRIGSAMDGAMNLSLFVRDALSNIDPAFRERYAELFETQNVQGLIRGKYFDEGATVRVALEVVSLVDGSLIGKKDLKLSKSEIPSSAPLLPVNYEKAKTVFTELSGAAGAANDGGFAVRVTTNRGAGAVFHDGEEMVLNLYATRDAYVKVYHVDVNGNIQLIFPNPFHRENFIGKDSLVRIPGDDHSFTFLLHEPYGVEYIKVLASSTQFAEIEAPFSDLGSGRKEVLTRGFSVVQKKGDLVEALVSYTITK